MAGISLTKLRDDVKHVRIQFGTDVLRLEVYPDRMTNEVLERYVEAQENPKDYDAMAAAFNEFVVSWDLVENDGDEEPLPIDGETFEHKISIRVLNHIFAEVTEAVTPKSRKKSGR